MSQQAPGKGVGRVFMIVAWCAGLQLGAIVLRDVRAVAAPGLEGEQVLLGMSALNKLEFTQRDGTMLLRQTTN